MKRATALSASVMCADILHLGDALAEIEQAGIAYIHADIMDGHFVPNLMLPPELLKKMRAATSLPFDYHLMVEKPETVLPMLDLREGDIVSVHTESTAHLERLLSAIRERGAYAFAAINPATPISVLSEVLFELDGVLLMTVNPGFAGQKLFSGAFDKIRRTRELLSQNGYDLPIMVDGNCSFENVPKMKEAGADLFVVGTSSVFCAQGTVAENTRRLLSLLQN